LAVYLLPDNVRIRLKDPIGRLIKNSEINHDLLSVEFESSSLKVAVGDATTEKLLSLDFPPDIEVVDGHEMRIKRKLPKSNYNTQIRVNNPPGCLTDEALQAISYALNAKMSVRILVEGEEDLLTLPILALYPIGTIVVYGQPGHGLVINFIDNNIRKCALSLLNTMGITI